MIQKLVIFVVFSGVVMATSGPPQKIVFLVNHDEAYWKYCVGAILDKNWVIAFCPEIKNVNTVVFGNSSYSEGKTFKVLEKIDHDKYTLLPYGPDKGKKSGTISFFTTDNAVSLYRTEDMKIGRGDVMKVQRGGWCCDQLDLTYTKAGEIHDYEEIYVDKDQRICQKEFRKRGLILTNHHICVEHSEFTNIDDCCNAQGILHSGDKLVGLTAWGTSCRNKFQEYQPFVVTNITFYADWIKKVTGIRV